MSRTKLEDVYNVDIEMFGDEPGRYGFRATSATGKIVAEGGGYASEKGARGALGRALRQTYSTERARTPNPRSSTPASSSRTANGSSAWPIGSLETEAERLLELASTHELEAERHTAAAASSTELAAGLRRAAAVLVDQ